MGKTLDARALLPVADEMKLTESPSTELLEQYPQRVTDLFRFPEALRRSTEGRTRTKKQDFCYTDVISARHAAYETWKKAMRNYRVNGEVVRGTECDMILQQTNGLRRWSQSKTEGAERIAFSWR